MIRRIVIALIPVVAVIALATLGYALLWGWSPLDALYMTIITVGTVGYREVHPLTDAGKLFTILVILSGIVAGGFALTRIFEALLETRLSGVWEVRRMNRRIGDLDGHTILAGLGRVGTAVARTLTAEGADFVIVDLSDESIEAARDEGWLFVQGDAAEEDVMREAGIGRAGSLVTALDTDAQNLFVAVTARSMNPELFIVARSSHSTTEEKLLKAGANRVLTPNVIGGRRMASMVLHPTVSDYLDLVAHGSGLEYRLQEVAVGVGSRLDGSSIGDARVRATTGAYILAVRREDGAIDSNPSADTVLHAGDQLVVLGTGAQVDSLALKA